MAPGAIYEQIAEPVLSTWRGKHLEGQRQHRLHQSNLLYVAVLYTCCDCCKLKLVI